MIEFRDRGARGRHDGATVQARHSFSFADYSDPRYMGFRDLRVLNEDWIVPGAGFAEHGHAEMEIVTFVLAGEIEHRDDMGNATRIRPGDVQRMSAGTGVRHSEMNASATDRAHVLQIWIMPHSPGGNPDYDQRLFDPSVKRNQWVEAVSPDGRDGSIGIRQDAHMLLARLDDQTRIERKISPERGYWLQVIAGIIGLNGTEMREGDGAAITHEGLIAIDTDTDAEVLLIDLP